MVAKKREIGKEEVINFINYLSEVNINKPFVTIPDPPLGSRIEKLIKQITKRSFNL